MKKFLALLLALVMVFALAACGESNEPSPATSGGDTASGEPTYVWKLAHPEEVEEGLAYGTTDIVYESIASLGNWSELANIDAYPYLYSSLDHFLAVWQSDFGEQLREEIGEQGGFKMVGTLYRGTRVVTSTKPINSIDDFNGFKIRTPTQQMYIKTWERLGATSTPLASADRRWSGKSDSRLLELRSLRRLRLCYKDQSRLFSVHLHLRPQQIRSLP